MRQTRWLAALLAGLLFLSACGGREEEPEGEGLRLWFAANGAELCHGPALESEPYTGEEDPAPEDLLAALLAGPSREELSSPFPRGVTLRRCGWDGDGVLLVDLSEQYGALTDISLTLADYCIVLTLSQLEGVEIVEITAGGRQVNYRGHQLLEDGEAVLWDELAQPGA